MALSATMGEGDPVFIGGTRKAAVLTIAFDSSYPAGGESVTPATYGFSTFDMVQCEPSMGYTFEYDHTNNKLKAFKEAPAIVIEEKHSTTTHYVTLEYPAAWIMSVAEASTAKIWTKTGLTTAQLGTNQFCLTTAIVDGERTQLTLNDKTATVYVTYVTQAWDELYKCLVQNEAVVKATTAATDLTLAYAPMGFGYCAKSTGTVFTPINIVDANATGEVAVDFAAGTATGGIRLKSTQVPLTVYVTYLKTAPAGSFIADRYNSDADLTTGVAGRFPTPVGVLCTSGYGPVSGGTCSRLITMDGTIAVQTFKILWGICVPTGSATGRAALQVCKGGGAATGKIAGAAYISCFPWEIPTVPLEVPDASDLSDLSGVRAYVVGR